MNWFEVFILSFVEGLTEFLPISSTGHLILTSAFLGLNENVFVQNFNIIIQFGAILSVLVLYWRRFFPIRKDFYLKLFISFLPLAALGFLLKSRIETLLGSVTVVAWALIVGGVFLIYFDRKAVKEHAGKRIDEMTWKDCVILGLIQCLALIPGISRSGATILGGLGLGLRREEATEYSFFLAIPTLTAAGLYKSYKLFPTIESSQINELLVGIALAFVFAMLAVKFFIHLVARFGFKHFGWYRIVLGISILVMVSGGWV